MVVLAGELLREAEKLINQKVHPMTIIAGFRMAVEVARDKLRGMAILFQEEMRLDARPAGDVPSQSRTDGKNQI